MAEATPVLNWLVAKIKNDSRAVNLWAIDYPSFRAISGGFQIVEGRALEQPFDLVMDTVLAEATATRVGDLLPHDEPRVQGGRASAGQGRAAGCTPASTTCRKPSARPARPRSSW